MCDSGRSWAVFWETPIPAIYGVKRLSLCQLHSTPCGPEKQATWGPFCPGLQSQNSKVWKWGSLSALIKAPCGRRSFGQMACLIHFFSQCLWRREGRCLWVCAYGQRQCGIQDLWCFSETLCFLWEPGNLVFGWLKQLVCGRLNYQHRMGFKRSQQCDLLSFLLQITFIFKHAAVFCNFKDAVELSVACSFLWVLWQETFSLVVSWFFTSEKTSLDRRCHVKVQVSVSFCHHVPS